MQGHYDVVILGGGLAGLTLARQLLLETDKTVLILERRKEIPPRRQKVGESTVQLAGHYLGKVLDLEIYLLHEHFMKYNLRFYWKNEGRDNSQFENYGHVAIRPFSNVPSYQLNRNTLERELLRLNSESSRCTLETGVSNLEVKLSEDDTHRLSFRSSEAETRVRATWVADTTGRGRYLARRMGPKKEMPIGHGAFFWWVEGTVDIERLTNRSRRDVRMRPERAALGHLPFFLATNHFMGEGLWFWVIPLKGKTSLGLVYDSSVIPHDEVFSVEKATRWVCEKFPLFARDLPHRKVLDSSGLRSFSHDCEQTINVSRWAMTGEAGRFTDPLYSPGSDLIAIHNTLIVAAIQIDDSHELAAACEIYEHTMRAVALAYVPSYGTSYDALGDQESFTLKYGWELSVYFAAYVFPFINDLFSDRRFLLAFLRFFSRLGPINDGLHRLLSDFYQWKKLNPPEPSDPVFFDLNSIGTVQEAEKCFYRVGVGVDEAREVLAEQLANLEELARFIVTYITAVVVGDRKVLRSRRFIEAIDLKAKRWELGELRRLWEETAATETGTEEAWEWSFDPEVFDCYHTESRDGGQK